MEPEELGRTCILLKHNVMLIMFTDPSCLF
jgi:hypothetical protein